MDHQSSMLIVKNKTEPFDYKSGCGNHASKCLSNWLSIRSMIHCYSEMVKSVIHGRNIEKIQVMKKELIIEVNRLSQLAMWLSILLNSNVI